ncbi:acetylornithine deacetylase [Acinetobacter portensis]|uniref:Acetylornithine deacetylase n=2 Tax=Acinetobacter TaxID=469 RepID=A0AB35UU29_9GAMM|nr:MULTISPECIES: acetylornithine deacetylase [Acinetobacter]MCK7609128.1 acetylornithine deacetylase [Acinetobacter portensis]MCK7639262.1 acetylornithine deacetylase [Acinetobacter portensis]MDY6483804.1 acetylornithine deacetylase [Acinetobacter faecalis]MDY6487458.1 acetylornithine deacetylase [Acinetobacter faecalis]MDY6490037.1 acetylornithine deacetylase [Acinetobacter faecalis]
MNDLNSIALLSKLIAFDTTSYKSNLDFILFIKELFEQNQIAVELNFNSERNKANLLASVGPIDQAGILLSGHSDVVPVEGQQWNTPAFEATQKDGNIYGRGTADMKGFLACAVITMLKASKIELKRALHLCISYDEEIGCIGVRGILDQLASTILSPIMCVIGEPTMMQLALAHKGKTVFRAQCCGEEGHSALAPNYVNAIHVASKLVESLQNVQQYLREQGQQDTGYDIPYTTVHVGKIAGGTALNIVPNACVVDYEIRHLAQDSSQDIQQQIIENIKQDFKVHIDVEEVNQYPGLKTSSTIEAVQFIQKLLPENTSVGNISFGTEGGLLQGALNCPVVVCGPGDIAVAHKPDEYVSIEQLNLCDAFLEKLLISLKL